MFQPVLPHMNGTTFTNKDYNVKLTCTGILRWYPNPSDIACKQICQVVRKQQFYIGENKNNFPLATVI